MKLGPVENPVFEMPPGLDADFHMFFVSDRAGLEAVIGIEGVTQFASAEVMLDAASKIMAEEQFTNVSTDWRLMTRSEVIDYRKRQHEEAKRGDNHHQEEAGPEPT